MSLIDVTFADALEKIFLPKIAPEIIEERSARVYVYRSQISQRQSGRRRLPNALKQIALDDWDEAQKRGHSRLVCEE